MFNISHNLNKKAQITVVFVDKNFKFLNQVNFFSKKELGQISLFKNDFGKSDFLKLDLLEGGKKQKIILYKIKERSSEFDYQKIGGTVYSELSKFESANILLESNHDIKKSYFLFSSNFLLGFFSRSYNFENYKLKKDNKSNLLKHLSIPSSEKEKLNKATKHAKDIFDGIEETRNLVTLPANILNPKKFVDEISKLKKIGVSVEILD